MDVIVLNVLVVLADRAHTEVIHVCRWQSARLWRHDCCIAGCASSRHYHWISASNWLCRIKGQNRPRESQLCGPFIHRRREFKCVGILLTSCILVLCILEKTKPPHYFLLLLLPPPRRICNHHRLLETLRKNLCGQMNKWLHSGGHPDHGSRSRIQICIVTLVRCALVEVCTDPVLLVLNGYSKTVFMFSYSSDFILSGKLIVSCRLWSCFVLWSYHAVNEWHALANWLNVTFSRVLLINFNARLSVATHLLKILSQPELHSNTTWPRHVDINTQR